MSTEEGCCNPYRRRVVGGSLSAGLLAVGYAGVPSSAAAASLTEAQRNAMTPDQAIKIVGSMYDIATGKVTLI